MRKRRIEKPKEINRCKVIELIFSYRTSYELDINSFWTASVISDLYAKDHYYSYELALTSLNIALKFVDDHNNIDLIFETNNYYVIELELDILKALNWQIPRFNLVELVADLTSPTFSINSCLIFKELVDRKLNLCDPRVLLFGLMKRGLNLEKIKFQSFTVQIREMIEEFED